MHEVKQAIIMAAGLGNRIRPVNNPVSMSPLSGDRKPQIRF